ncbi:MAG: DUF2141 domain-containing protein [Chryseotalea sp.]|jgi:uncharacterized protein (DUF2141 family)|nr:DUF2141 domain-containing protein [Cytophagales bacterium]
MLRTTSFHTLSFSFLFLILFCFSISTTQAQFIAELTEKPINITNYLVNIDNSNISSKKETYSITITVTNIRSRKGSIRFKFYDDATPFPHDTGILRMVVPKTEFEGNTFTVTVEGLPSRNMGIALLDDENDDNELDMGWFFPKEGHAFSDYFHTAFRKPTYDDFDFVLNADRKVVMKVRYY